MEILYKFDYETIETHLEKVRFFYTRGDHSESILLLDQLINHYSRKDLSQKEIIEITSTFRSEKALIHMLLDNFKIAKEILDNLEGNREKKDENIFRGAEKPDGRGR